ncbi:MAG: ABC transporter ATP-binding protein [Acidobacteria bacterium]|nr:ABC transporter ATP-binding protein [Acidobacteriota bacterium]
MTRTRQKGGNVSTGTGIQEVEQTAKLSTLLRAENLTKAFRSGKSDLMVLENLQLEVEAGEMVAIVGESGSGKSTLLHILGALDKPSAGEVYFDGKQYSELSENELGSLRNHNFGFVWQLRSLLLEFTARENVAMPLRIRGVESKEAAERAEGWLERVGLKDRATHRAGELSGGEQQRAVLARALVGEPKVLMADEPTGNLDARAGEMTMQLLGSLHQEFHMTTVLVTHNMGFARRCDRVLRLENGRLEAVSFSETI